MTSFFIPHGPFIIRGLMSTFGIELQTEPQVLIRNLDLILQEGWRCTNLQSQKNTLEQSLLHTRIQQNDRHCLFINLHITLDVLTNLWYTTIRSLHVPQIMCCCNTYHQCLWMMYSMASCGRNFHLF